MAVTQTMVVTPATLATGTIQRTVSDEIRRLNPAVTPVMALVKSGGVDEMGNASQGDGLISKAKSDHMKFEWFTSTPIDMYYTATGGSSTTAVIAATDAFVARDVIVNLTTFEVAVVNTVTSATTLTVTNVSAAWSCAAGDVIAMACNTHEEGSSSFTSRTKEPDNNYNFCFPFRYAISIAATAKNSPHYGGDVWERYRTDNTYFAMRNVENNLILGQRAASGNTTAVTISAVSYPLFTTRGLRTFASAAVDAGGALSWDDWQTRIFQAIPKTQTPNEPLKMLCGRKRWSNLMQWANSKLIYMESGEPDTFGVRPKRFQCGAYTIEPIMHDLYDQGGLESEALIFNPKDLVYRFKTGLDIAPKNGIQTPATWGETDELRGVVGLQCWSGGANILKITGWSN